MHAEASVEGIHASTLINSMCVLRWCYRIPPTSDIRSLRQLFEQRKQENQKGHQGDQVKQLTAAAANRDAQQQSAGKELPQEPAVDLGEAAGRLHVVLTDLTVGS